MGYTDILYDAGDGIATITINRPKVLNAFRAETVTEMIEAFHAAWADRTVGVVILTGAGEKAFCAGGDQSVRDAAGYQGPPARSALGLDIEELPVVIRDISKPVLAAVNGWAIGGGNVLQVICDLSIAAESARFGQVGPRVGSVDPGLGTAYLARVVGEKKAREIWYLCRQYSAADALAMGLVNKGVPLKDLRAEGERGCAELLDKSPTARTLATHFFNTASEPRAGVAQFAHTALRLYYQTDD